MRARFFQVFLLFFLLFSTDATAEVPEWKWIEWEMMDVLAELPNKQAVKGVLDSSDATTATLKLSDGTLHKLEQSDVVELYRMSEYYGVYNAWKAGRKASWIIFGSGLFILALEPINQCDTGGCVSGPVLAIGGGALLLIGNSKMKKAKYIEKLLENAKTSASLAPTKSTGLLVQNRSALELQ